MGEIKIQNVYNEEICGKFIHRSLDAKNKFTELFRSSFQNEKESIVDKKEELLIKSLSSLDRKQKIDLLLAWNNFNLIQEAKESSALPEDDPAYKEDINTQLGIIVERERTSLNSLSDDSLDKKIIEEGKNQVSLAPAIERAYKYLIFETFRISDNLKQRVFHSAEEVGEMVSEDVFNKLINARIEFDRVSVGDEELKK